jgi:hypothetical protein
MGCKSCEVKASSGNPVLIAEASSCGCNGDHDHDHKRKAPAVHFTQRARNNAAGLAVAGWTGQRTNPGLTSGGYQPAGDPINAQPSTAQTAANTAQNIVGQAADLGRTAIDAETQRQRTAADVRIAEINAQTELERARIAAEQGTQYIPQDQGKDSTQVTVTGQPAPPATTGMAWWKMVLIGVAVLVVIGGIYYYVTRDGRRVRAPDQGRARMLAARNPNGYGETGSRYASKPKRNPSKARRNPSKAVERAAAYR